MSKKLQKVTSKESSDLQISTRKMAPRLKAGVTYWRSDITRQLHIGTRFANYLLPDQIGSLEIESALQELSKGSGVNREGLEVLLTILEDLSLIDNEYTQLQYQYGNDEVLDIASSIQRSVAQESFVSRIRIESDGISRLAGVKDGGTKKILARRKLAIEIYGDGRIAFALLGSLSASGFDLTEIASEVSIKSKDILGGCITKRDIGRSSTLKGKEISLDASLFPEPLELMKSAELIISIGSPPPEVLERWNRSKIPQLFIDFDTSGEIRIGPYVSPGIGACYNCINIAEVERGRTLINSIKSSLPQEKEERSRGRNGSDVTAALTNLGTGLVTIAVTQIADTGISDLHERTVLYSMLQFLEPQITSWERSPRCSCNWI